MSNSPCFLCEPDPKLVFYRGAQVLGLYSGNLPLLVTKRHRTAWIEATAEEQTELLTAVAKAHEEVLARGYDIEIREAPHLHVRLVPKPAPLPDRVLDRPLATSFAPTVVTGESDPLLPYLRRHLDEAENDDLLASFILESGVALLEGRFA